MRRKRRKRRLASRGYIFLIAVAITLAHFVFGGNTEEQVSTVTEVPALELSFTTPDTEPTMTTPTPEPTPTPMCSKPVDRYSEITMSDEELDELAEIIYHEARGESPEGQQAVAEVVFNRVIADNFPDTVHDVIRQGQGTSVLQFSTIKLLGTAEPLQAQYDAINAALYGPSILPDDVVFFSRKGENDRVWGEIGNHVFCYQYVWD